MQEMRNEPDNRIMIYLLLNISFCLLVLGLAFSFFRKYALLSMSLLYTWQFPTMFFFALCLSLADVLLLIQLMVMLVLLIACMVLFFFRQKYKPLALILLLLPLLILFLINVMGGYFMMS